ncbi:DciA family protein [Streptomyces sp. NPDC090741]|uniref:DciA family protein n=1 Tax=Streptomyces sp. NPDC090741 TaxID=3365967 RepID=UPI003815171C
MTTTETTGADLARMALMAARKAAAARGEHSRAQAKPKRRRSAHRGDGRDPLDLKAVFKRLADERGWDEPLVGGQVIDRWKDIVSGEVADRLQPVRFDEPTGRLELLPESPAWALQGRLISAQLLDQVNAELGAGAVREIEILAPGTRRPGHIRQDERPEAVQPTLPPPAVDRYAPAGYHAVREVLAGRTGPMIAGPALVRPDEDKCEGFHHARAGLRPIRTAPMSEPAEIPVDRSQGYHRARAGLRPMAPPTSAAAVQYEATSGYTRALHRLRSSKVLSAAPE